MTENRPFASLSSGLLARKGGARPAMRRPSLLSTPIGEHALDDLGWNDMGYDVDPLPEAHDDKDRLVMFNPLARAIPETTPEVRRQQEEIAAKLHATIESSVFEADMTPVTEYEAAGYEAEAEAQFEAETQFEAGAQADSEARFETGFAAETPVADEAVEALDAAPAVDAQPLAMADAAEEAPIADAPLWTAPAPVLQVPAVRKTAPRRPRAAAGQRLDARKAAFTLRLNAERHMRLRLACAVRGSSAQRLVTKALDELLASMPELDQLMEHMPPQGVQK